MSNSESGRRLARAFAVVGFQGERLANAIECNTDHDDRAIVVNPSVLFLYPNEDGDDMLAILDGVIETRFSRPQGYQILEKSKQPDFHTIRLTDRQCRVTYISVLTFYEPANNKYASSSDDNSSIFVPKFLVIISDIQLSDLFKTCLRSIYEKMALEGGDVDCLNRAIANIVNYRMPPPGLSSQLSLGFGEALTVHSPSAKSVPKTGLNVYRLVQTLGPENTAKSFFCILSQLQVTMYSADVSFLTDSCEALLALLYPFEYYFIYAPVQTKRCLERHKILENPTPFFIGICEPPDDVLREVFDKVVLIDLDNSNIRIPSSVPEEITDIDKRLATQLVDDLRAVTNSIDYVVDQRTAEVNLSRANLIEKRLRACFLKFHASLICDYRQSLSAVRIHPKPRIFFDRAHFFGRRRLRYQPNGTGQSSFLSNFVDIFLEQILKDRKLPVREADFFDELCALLCGMTGEKIDSIQLVDDIAKYLLDNDKLAVSENCPPNVVARYLASLRTCPFPSPNRTRIAKFSYEMNYETKNFNNSTVVISPVKNRFNNNDNNSGSNSSSSPNGTMTSLRHGRIMAGTRHGNNFQIACCGVFVTDQIEDRMGIYSAYIACIFARELKKGKSLIVNIQKTIESESIEVRRRIPFKLLQYCHTLTLVDGKQFWTLAKIVYSLLVLESPWDENGIAASLLPVLRNLQMAENKRFLYTTVQHLPVWRNELFWVAVACRHIAADISARYENRCDLDLDNEPCHSVDVLAKILEKEQPGKASDEASEVAIALTWCKHFTDLMIAFLIYYDYDIDNAKEQKKGNDSGISIDDEYYQAFSAKSDGYHASAPSVEYHVSYAVEEMCKEANLSPACLEAMKVEIAGKIDEQVRYIQNLPQTQTRGSSESVVVDKTKNRKKSLMLVNLLA